MPKQGFISADSHVYEPPQLWAKYIDAAFRDRAPRLVSHGEKDMFFVDTLGESDVALVNAAGKDYEEITNESRFEEGLRGGYDPAARIKDMDVDGVEAEVLYPSLCMGMYKIKDAPYQYACFAAYNDWLADFSAEAPKRLIGVGLVSLANIGLGIAELRRIAAKGLRGACIAAVAPEDQPYSSPAYDPFWAAAEELRMPLSFHVQTGSRSEMDLPDFITAYAVLPRWVQTAIAAMITSGVMERFPGLRVASVESDIGWIATFLRRMDHAWERHRHWSGSGAKLHLRPSEYFHRQVYATFMDDISGIKAREEAGVGNLMWSSDYPHSDSTWPHSKEVIERLFKGVSEEDTRKIVHDNAAKVYNLP